MPSEGTSAAFTIADLERMAETRIIAHDERSKLIGEEFVPMSAKGLRHEGLEARLTILGSRFPHQSSLPSGNGASARSYDLISSRFDLRRPSRAARRRPRSRRVARRRGHRFLARSRLTTQASNPTRLSGFESSMERTVASMCTRVRSHVATPKSANANGRANGAAIRARGFRLHSTAFKSLSAVKRRRAAISATIDDYVSFAVS